MAGRRGGGASQALAGFAQGASDVVGFSLASAQKRLESQTKASTDYQGFLARIAEAGIHTGQFTPEQGVSLLQSGKLSQPTQPVSEGLVGQGALKGLSDVAGSLDSQLPDTMDFQVTHKVGPNTSLRIGRRHPKPIDETLEAQRKAATAEKMDKLAHPGLFRAVGNLVGLTHPAQLPSSASSRRSLVDRALEGDEDAIQQLRNMGAF